MRKREIILILGMCIIIAIGAKAIKLTRTLKKGGALGAEYSLEAYSVESIMSAAAAG